MRLALWLLRRVADEALVGDVMEQGDRGTGWLWKQVLSAGLSRLARLCGWPQRHEAEIGFACAGMGIHLAVTFVLTLLPYPARALDFAANTLTIALALPVLGFGLGRHRVRGQMLGATAVFASVAFSLPLAGVAWWARVFGVMLVAALAGVTAGADRSRADAAN